MDKTELWKRVSHGTSPNLDPKAVKSAYDCHLQYADSKHVHHHQCIVHIIQDAGERQQLAYLLAPHPSDEQSQDSQLPLSITRLQLQEERLITWVKPSVEKLREMIFGDTVAPFSSYAYAVKWLEETAKTQREPSRDDWYAAANLRREIEEQIREWEKLIRSRISRPRPDSDTNERGILYRKPPADSPDAPYHEWTPAFIYVYIDPDYGFKDGLMPLLVPNCPLGQTAPLSLIEMVTHEIAEKTGFSQTGVIAHVLADLPLVLPIGRFQVKASMGLWHGWVEIKLYTPDIPVRVLQGILSGIRKQWRVMRTKRLTDDDYRLLKVVKQAGGAPQTGAKGTVAFWEKIKYELGLDISWRGVQKKHERLIQKLHPKPMLEKK